MATAEAVRPRPRPAEAGTRDSSVSPMSRSPRDLSPSVQSLSQEEEMLQKSNGYVSSPLRTQQRLASLDEKQLPDLPHFQDDARPATATNKAPSVRWSPPTLDNSFPFEAQNGATGQTPTTGELRATNGTGDSSPHATPRKKNGKTPGTATPPRRRSVQFARGLAEEEAAPLPLHKTTTWETDNEDDMAPSGKERERQASFFGKLKALRSPASSTYHSRGQSSSTGFMTPSGAGALSPQSERSEPSYPVEPSEAAEQADVDEDSEEHDQVQDLRPKKRRKSKRPVVNTTDSVPNTPRQSRFASFIRDREPSGSRPSAPPRRNTLSDMSDHAGQGAGVSEDEGRDRVRTAWRRGLEGARGLSYSARKQQQSEPDTPGSETRRPGHLRRFTGMAGSAFAGDGSNSPFRMRAERQASSSAQKWKQVKAGLRMLGQKKRDERMRVDHQKSAQLMAELLAGAPAALVFASMYQRDEHGHRKVPVLLEQLKIRITDSDMRKDHAGDRHLVFKMDLEYGNGPARMQWTIRRTLQDFANLHFKYKSQAKLDSVRHFRGEDKSKAKMPRFPKSAFPYARTVRGLFEKIDDDEDEAEEVALPPTPGANGLFDGSVAGDGSGTERPGMGKHRRKTSFFAPPRRTSTGDLIPQNADPNSLSARQKELYNERQRRKLETYLQQMIRWLIFRADSTRLCKFLEVSALAIRLSAEGGWQGKQGLLTIYSGQSREVQKKRLLGLATGGFAALGNSIAERHKPRWFLVRHSYLVCVDGPESSTPYDVFLVDSDFRTEKAQKRLTGAPEQQTSAVEKDGKVQPTKASKAGKHHLIRLYNAERKLKLIARSERQYIQFQESINSMMQETIWAKKQRFASFAPVRHGVWARWLVDGRDHMWQVSRAIDNAKDFIYIHDWWLSPELYLRRPAAISQKWRLDRLLQRKAQEGVKIFVIVYRNIESAIPIDSEYTKWSLLDLHENICVQRSPNQFKQNQFFWAHHEKLVVVDNMMAFVGGVDLCFGRWDDSCHSLTDDKLTGFELETEVPRDSEHCQVWPGKDYSNPRVQDFYALDRPYEEMYDRTKVPRMPWHDIAMQMVGQPARDVGRHFVQRWNYILRNRIPTRPTPMLIPPPEYEQAELERLGMNGSCQVQILRSCSNWSIGYANGKVEHSIMNAYCHLIRTSDHFVYIENQFYISSCTVEGTPIHNKIGDALVERAIRAYENGEQWQACLVIPLMPGFQNSVDSQDGTSIRLIMQCQYRSICRGETSIFGRLKARGIEPEDYIRFYSLRQWGKIGPRKCLTTEQLYIHAKCMVVDDRSAIIGSANINERSMLGSRDSEVASVVTDTKMLPSFMGGKPYDVGEFPHTLRKRLMREHLGIDVDAIYRREQAHRERDEQNREMERIYRDEYDGVSDGFQTPPHTPAALTERNLANVGGTERGRKNLAHGWGAATLANSAKDSSEDESTEHMDPAERLKTETRKEQQRDLDVEGYGFDNAKALADAGDYGLTDTFVDQHGREVLLKKDAPDAKRIKNLEEQDARRRSESAGRKADVPVQPPWPMERLDTINLGLATRSTLPELPALDDTDIGGPPLTRGLSATSAKVANPLLQSMRRPEIHEDCMTDPLALGFYHDIWNTVAENNTKLYRQVFRCMPDSEVLDWRAYERFNDYNDRFMQSQGLGSSQPSAPKDAPGKSGPPGSGATEAASVVAEAGAKTRARSKSLLSTVAGKLRPGSRASEETRTEVLNEKEGRAIPGSPAGSAGSSEPTAVPPSPASAPFDEKEAGKQQTDGDMDEKASSGAPRVEVARQRTVQYSDTVNQAPETTATQTNTNGSAGLQYTTSQRRRRRGTTKSSARPGQPEEVLSREEAEELLKLVQGHLVTWPYDWLEKEERGGNWLYSIDQLAPLEIYD
ncbi:hypothetical protein LTR36_007965 [Oleoguttula mirabilis]|uniref:Phospholipase D1 n=1 Tax=Oleoguttula mirabilis TaxID=1507867 RepID=A0AAV9J9W6_9PEZI|nr:hypothetical protein LTR36_007965 [Oleoguttula mirabilis]